MLQTVQRRLTFVAWDETIRIVSVGDPPIHRCCDCHQPQTYNLSGPFIDISSVVGAIEEPCTACDGTGSVWLDEPCPITGLRSRSCDECRGATKKLTPFGHQFMEAIGRHFNARSWVR